MAAQEPAAAAGGAQAGGADEGAGTAVYDPLSPEVYTYRLSAGGQTRFRPISSISDDSADPERSNRDAALAARASRSFVDAHPPGDGDVGLWIASCDYDSMSGGAHGRAKVSQLLVCTRGGTWQPASSMYEFVQQIVMELVAHWVDKEAEAKAAYHELSDVESDDEYDESFGWEAMRAPSASL